MRRLAALCLTFAAAGCATLPGPTLTPGASASLPATETPSATSAIAYPNGPDDVVLRLFTDGGLLNPADTLEASPEYTLYGDGRVIYSSRTYNGMTITADIRQARLSEAQVDAVLIDALGEGGLSEAATNYPDAPITDVGTTEFEIHAGGIEKTVRVYALDWTEDVPDAAMRARLAALAQRLNGIAADASAQRVVDLGIFEPTHYRLTLDQPYTDFAVRPWPWPDVEPSLFGFENGDRAKIITSDQASAIADPPTSLPQGVVLLGPDGTEHLIRLRPLLPDQVD